MDIVQLSTEGLRLTGAHYAAVATELTGDMPARQPGPPHQATAAAVTSTCEVVAGASGVLAARLLATGAEFVEAADDYLQQDESSGHYIAALGAAIEA